MKSFPLTENLLNSWNIPDHPLFPLLLGVPVYYSGRYPHRYLKLEMSSCPQLYEYLVSQGIRLWLPNNSGRCYYIHQIVGFFFCGGIESLNHYGHSAPKDLAHTHHLNANTLDNRPANLSLLSADDHHLITKHQRGAFKRVRLFEYSGLNNHKRTQFNHRGRPIKNWLAWISTITALTLKLTHNWVTGFKGYLIGVVEWVEKFTHRLIKEHDTSFLPNPQWMPFLSDMLD